MTVSISNINEIEENPQAVTVTIGEKELIVYVPHKGISVSSSYPSSAASPSFPMVA